MTRKVNTSRSACSRCSALTWGRCDYDGACPERYDVIGRIETSHDLETSDFRPRLIGRCDLSSRCLATQRRTLQSDCIDEGSCRCTGCESSDESSKRRAAWR